MAFAAGVCNCKGGVFRLNSGKTRASLFGIVALYLLHLAYELFESRVDPNTTMTPFARIMFIALFVIASVCLIVYAVRVWRRSGQDEEEQKQSEQDEQNMK